MRFAMAFLPVDESCCKALLDFRDAMEDIAGALSSVSLPSQTIPVMALL